MTSSAAVPFVVSRDSFGLNLFKWEGDSYSDKVLHISQSSSECRVYSASHDGKKLAYCDAEGVSVIDIATQESIMKLPLPRTLAIKFSPRGDTLCTWENFSTTRENAFGKENLRIFSIPEGELIHSLIQKDLEGIGLPQWYPGSNECAILTGNTVNFYPDGQFKKGVKRLHIDKLSKFELSGNIVGRQHVACFIRGTKGAPSSVRLFARDYYNQNELLSNKSFYKADQVKLNWNDKGNAILVTAMQESDSTGQSYYGTQALHFLSTNGESSLVGLTKQGPIYDAKWSPDSSFFCVVFGFMPAKAALFNLKCDQVFEFKPALRNECIFNLSHGNLLALCGFGNLRGTIEIWDVKSKKQVAEYQAPDTTAFEWCPDGAHFMTATTTPRLRVNNGFKWWHYTRGTVGTQKCEKALFNISWQPVPSTSFPTPDEHIKSGTTFTPAKAPAAYVPPHARGNPAYKTRLSIDEDEGAHMNGNKMSKTAMKNKKKRGNNKSGPVLGDKMTSEQKDAVKMAQYLLGQDEKPQHANGVEKSEKDKKLKNIRKKLVAIDKLKHQQAQGKVLEKNQVEKLATEEQLKKELEKLELE